MIALSPIVELAIRLAIGLLFASSVVHKLCTPVAFAGTVEAYFRGTPLGTATVGWIAASLVVVMEAGVVALSLLPGPAPLAGASGAALFLLYAAAMGTNIARGNVLLDCGCAWAAMRQPVSIALVLRNLVLAAVAGLLLFPAGTPAVEPSDFISAVILAGLLLLTYLIGNQLILNAQQMKAKWI